jgi:hypothetical protein
MCNPGADVIGPQNQDGDENKGNKGMPGIVPRHHRENQSFQR